jgi:hypothetical protein
MFEKTGRVKCISLRGEKSEGYIVPVSNLESFIKDVLGKDFKITDKMIGTDFDQILDHQICKKYIPSNTRIQNVSGKKNKGNSKKLESKLIENQFHLHEDTSNLKKEIGKISPDDYISISDKLHGSNGVVSHVLCKKKLSWKDRFFKLFGANIVDSEYGLLYSSRNVIKNAELNDEKTVSHYYDSDIWKIAADRVFPVLPKGISVTGELVGFTPSNKPIQKYYDYGCSPGTLDFYVFKVTSTSIDGKVHVFSHRETVDFCQKMGLKMPKTFYYGKAKDLFPELDTEQQWHEAFLQKLTETYLEKDCSICKNKVPAEGVIVRKDVPFEWEAYKLKSFSFLLKESKALDAGEGDFEEINNE